MQINVNTVFSQIETPQSYQRFINLLGIYGMFQKYAECTSPYYVLEGVDNIIMSKNNEVLSF